MQIKYLRRVTSPGWLAGEIDETKEISDQAAVKLIAQGYAEKVRKTKTKGKSNAADIRKSKTDQV